MTLPLVVVVGPTAAGKTDLAVWLARRIDAELVSADALQVYRGMTIGTAKPTPDLLQGLPCHLIDVVDPHEHFDAHRFVELADRAIEQASSRGKRVIVVGGTGLYARSLVRGLASMPGADPELREALTAEADALGRERLHERLARVDPAYAARVMPRDIVRVVRALEVYQLTGHPISELHGAHERRPDRYPSVWIGLDPGQAALRERIVRRTEQMFADGFVDEVRGLLAHGYGPELPSMRSLGYRHVASLLRGEVDETGAKRLTVRDTARFARRQRNWFRSEPAVEWAACATPRIEGRVLDFLRSCAAG